MEQSKALAILKSGRNVFLTGSAGTGKTYVLNQYIEYLYEKGVGVAITGSTGIAATHLNGQTIHSWSGIGIKEHLSGPEINRLKSKSYLKKGIENAQVLLIDEISMLHKKQLDLVNRVLQVFKQNAHPFGGMQVICSGDFFQLPPVSASRETNREKFAFMSQAWLEANFHICYLTKQYRQQKDVLTDILNNIRSGEISETTLKQLQGAKTEQNEEVTRLYTHNEDVDRINLQRLEAINDKTRIYTAKKQGNKKLVETLEKSVLTDAKLKLKVGSEVMFIKNNFDRGYVNGTRGKVVFFDSGDKSYPVVETKAGQQILVEPEQWVVANEKGDHLATYQQIPLRLAWAITIHKSQGMTLDAAEIDLSRSFESGQGYVALSRLRSLDGLNLTGFCPSALRTDSLVKKADKRFQELSEEVDAQLSLNTLAEEAQRFLERAAKKKKKKKKKSTYEVTKELIEEGLNIEEIAFKRDLTPNTIVNHLAQIKKKFPETDLERFKPEEKILTAVLTAHEKLKKEQKDEYITEKGAYRMSMLHQKLKGKYSYDALKVSLSFEEG